MNFNIGLFNREGAPSSAKPAETPNGTQPKGGNFGGNMARMADSSDALGVAAYYRAVELRAKTMSQLRFEYQKRNDAPHGGNYEADMRGGGARINYMIQVRPNPMMTWPTLISQAEVARMNQGNAVLYIDRNTLGEIEAIWLCTNATLNVASMKYNITYTKPGGSYSIAEVPARDVIHLRNTFTTSDGMAGMSTMFYAQKTLQLAATNDKLVRETASKGGKMKLIVQEDKQGTFGVGRANKQQLEKIAQQLNEDIYSKDVVLLNNVANVTPISQSLQQQEIQVARSFSVREVARFTGTPAIMLMDDSNSSYKSPEAATQEYLLRTIAPLMLEWEMEFNSKILGMEGWPTHRFKFIEETLLRMDPAGRANIDKVHLETGVKCVNELRAGYDLPSIQKGDTHYVSTNLAELGSEKLSKISTKNAPGGQEGEPK